MRKSLEELEINKGKVVHKYDKREFSGTIVSTYPTGEVRTETTVENGAQLNSTTYDKSGKVLSQTKPTLASKEGKFGYQDVSLAYKQYHKKRQENASSHLILIVSILGLVILLITLANRFSGKKT